LSLGQVEVDIESDAKVCGVVLDTEGDAVDSDLSRESGG
jgi:hypothetical protein